MNAQILDGRFSAEKIREGVKKSTSKFFEKTHQRPLLSALLVGTHPPSMTYVRMKRRACEEVGMDFRLIELPEHIKTKELLGEIDSLNQDERVSGILLQHPVPKQIDEREAFDRISVSKDVDGVSSLTFGRMSLGMPSFHSCTPEGMIRLLKLYQIPIEGKHAVILGRSPILGRPLSMLLLGENATVTVCHSRSLDLPHHLNQADIVAAACGIPKLVKGEWLKEGAVVLDAGYSQGNVGDVDFESCSKKASWITPVPGGVGPMTIAILLENTLQAACSSLPR